MLKATPKRTITKKKTPIRYENRVVCFIDILGFEKVINKTLLPDGKDDPAKIKLIYNTIMTIRKHLDIAESKITKSKMVTQFSDSVVISFRVNATSEVFFTLVDIQHILAELVFKGMLCRGGIAFGKLLHTAKALFGPALNQAYKMESKAALYPRVILDESIIKLGAQHCSPHHTPEIEEEYIRQCVGKDSDGMFYIDYFASAYGEFDEPEIDFCKYLFELTKMTRAGLNSEDPGVRVKYSWLREKINPLIRAGKKRSFLKSIGDSDLVDAYKSLEEV
jgi:hypothetical protein